MVRLKLQSGGKTEQLKYAARTLKYEAENTIVKESSPRKLYGGMLGTRSGIMETMTIRVVLTKRKNWKDMDLKRMPAHIFRVVI